MAAGNVGQFLIDKEVQAELEKHEELKRIGHAFIRIVYTGRHTYPRLHGFHNLGIVKEYDPDTGKEEARAAMDDRVIEFRRATDGRMTADVLDDEHNRYAISRILDQVSVDNDRLAKEISALTDRKYVVEPDRKTQLMREKERIDAELAAMQAPGSEPEPVAEAIALEPDPVQPRRREMRPRRAVVLHRRARRTRTTVAASAEAAVGAATNTEGTTSG